MSQGDLCPRWLHLLICCFVLAVAALGQASVPYIANPLVPSDVNPGGPDFALTVNGSGFASGASVRWNNTPLTTVFISATRLTASVPAALITKPANISITVVNPGVNTASNVAYLPVGAPVKNLTLTYAPDSPLDLPIPAPCTDALCGEMAGTMTTADFNNDGNTDAAVTIDGFTGPGYVEIFLSNGDGTFSMPSGSFAQTGAGPEAITAGDFNGDGKLDLAVANGDNTIDIFLGNGDGTFRPAPGSPLRLINPPVAIVSADFAHSGHLQLAVLTTNWATGSSYLHLLMGAGDGTFSEVPGSALSLGSTIGNLAIGDFNADGNLDLAVPLNAGFESTVQIAILLGAGNGTFSESTVKVANLGLPQLASADFNGDGIPDLALAGNGTAGVLLGNGDGTFTLGPALGSNFNVAALQPADFEHKGFDDLILATQDWTEPYALQLWSGNGDGSFTPAAGISAQLPSIIAVGNFNNNGQLDLLVLNPASEFTPGQLAVLQPAAAAPPGILSLQSSGPTTVTVSSGQTATYSATISASGGDISSLSFSCGGVPQYSVCTVAPTPDHLTSGQSVDLVLSVQTSVQPSPFGFGQSLSKGGNSKRVLSALGRALVLARLVVALLLLTALWLMTTSRRRWATAVLSIALIAVCLGATACGGAPFAFTPPALPTPPPPNQTPAGSSTITLTATSRSFGAQQKQSVQYTLVVQ